MERAGKKTRDIQFYSEKNAKMVCLHSPAARDCARYLEEQSWVVGYEAGTPLSEDLYCHVSSVGIRSLYFKTSWASDFLLHFADGRRGIRAGQRRLSSEGEYRRAPGVFTAVLGGYRR